MRARGASAQLVRDTAHPRAKSEPRIGSRQMQSNTTAPATSTVARSEILVPRKIETADSRTVPFCLAPSLSADDTARNDAVRPRRPCDFLCAALRAHDG